MAKIVSISNASGLSPQLKTHATPLRDASLEIAAKLNSAAANFSSQSMPKG